MIPHAPPDVSATGKAYNTIGPADLDYFRTIVGAQHVLHAQADLANYSHDYTEHLQFYPEAAVRPATAQQVSHILAHCNKRRIPVTPQGGRTGLSGAALPTHGGVALSLERMNNIVAVDTRNLQITVEPGVITQHVDDAAAAHGLYYPPDPSSKGSCFIGGNLAHNAGGAHAVKYGITNAYVLALQVVLASGEIIHTGAHTLKNSTGYNLTQLLVGSEGTLGVITQATLKLVPRPQHKRTMLVPFADAQHAADAVSAVFRAGLVPSVLEFIERDGIIYGQRYLNMTRFSVEGVEAHLLLEFDGNDPDAIMVDCTRALEVLEQHHCGEALFAESAEQQNELWRLRRCLAEAVKGQNVYRELDIAVPRAELARLLRKVKEVGARYGTHTVCYGHAGDGNLHINLLKGELSDGYWNTDILLAIREIFAFAVSLGGTLSGEHGIGHVQRPYMDVRFAPAELALMRSVKHAFDPNGILNPGKVL
jgi:glycolate oxidase